MIDVEFRKPLDFMGRVIKEGDVCVYPTRRGSNLWLNKIKVSSFNWGDDGVPVVNGVKPDGYSVTITQISRLVIIGRDDHIPYMEN